PSHTLTSMLFISSNDPSTTELYTLSLHDALPISPIEEALAFQKYLEMGYKHQEIADKVSKSRSFVTTRLRLLGLLPNVQKMISEDRKSTRLNSSHVSISYAVFCLKKKKKTKSNTQ